MKAFSFYITASFFLTTNIFGQNNSVTTLKFQDSCITRYYDLQKLSKATKGNAYSDFKQATRKAQKLIDSINGELTFEFNNQLYDAIIVNPQEQQIKMHWLAKDNTPHKSISSVKQELEKQKNKVLMLTNGGMYLKNNYPQGLFISEGKELKPLDIDSNKYGNFYMKPNGIFYSDSNGFNIATTSNFSTTYDKKNSTIRFATQSGPMLVINGKIHQKFMHQSKNLHLRSGVGILPNGNIIFIISRSNKTNFHDFASIFKDVFGCNNALYLDGAISKMYLPKLRPKDLEGNFGVIISVTE